MKRNKLLGFTGAVAASVATLAAVSVFAGSDDIAPAPASIGTDIPLTYFGPAPSQVQKELIGPLQLLKSGPVDTAKGTITLPLYKGRNKDGKIAWYVLTDTTDKENAEALGLNHSGKLYYAATCKAARQGRLERDSTITFDNGTVDFSPVRQVVPGDAPNLFPPKTATPGSVGDSAYSPLVRLINAGGHIYNAPMIAFNVDADKLDFCDKPADHNLVHDKVVNICPSRGTVTLDLTAGFSFARPVLYLSTESNDPTGAALEGATLAPGLSDVQVGHDDGAFSGVERLFLFVNGPTNQGAEVNPQRQGLYSALSGQGGPLNVLGGIPTIATDYSPLWDVNIGEWTAEAISLGYRSRMTEEFAILGMAAKGWLTGPGGKPYGSTGLVVNCPIVFRFL